MVLERERLIGLVREMSGKDVYSLDPSIYKCAPMYNLSTQTATHASGTIQITFASARKHTLTPPPLSLTLFFYSLHRLPDRPSHN